MEYLEDFLKTHQGKYIALVGNGVITSNLGAEIDSHDYVIRFNEYKDNYIDPTYKENIGEKTDYHCVEGFQKDYSLTKDYDVYKICPRPKNETYRYYNPLCSEGKYDIEIREKYGDIFGTTGILLASLLNKLHISHNLYGFDFYATGYKWLNGKDNLKTIDAHNILSVDEMEDKIFRIINDFEYSSFRTNRRGV